jgi:hypothetical protein
MTPKQPEPTFHEALTTVLDYLWDDERRAYEAAPPHERPRHVFASLCVLDRDRDAAPCDGAARLAWAAVRQLLDAYVRGEEEGGSIDWDDVDLAHELACEAVGQTTGDGLVGTPDGREAVVPDDACAERRVLAAYLVAIADPGYGDYDLREALASACQLARLVLGHEGEVVCTPPCPGEFIARNADDALVRLRAIAVRLVDDDDHDCDLTEELEVACEMATLFRALDAALSAGAPRPRAWQSVSKIPVPLAKT